MIQATGLSTQEAQQRLEKHGANELESKKQIGWLKILFNQFKSPLIYILFLAGLVTLYLNDWTDSLVIFLAVGLNTILGFFQEYKAERSLIALKQMLVPYSRVVRDGKEILIETKNLVPGDLVILLPGNKVPADGVVVESVDLKVDEAMLTGESVAVEKETASLDLLRSLDKNMGLVGSTINLTRCSHAEVKTNFCSVSELVPRHNSGLRTTTDTHKNCLSPRAIPQSNNFPPMADQPWAGTIQQFNNNSVFMGTVVSSGRGKMLVTKTGKQTKMGQIAFKLQTTNEEETPLKKQINGLSKTLALIFSFVCLAIFIVGLLQGKDFLTIFTLAVAVAVAAIPESLVISLTVILSIGMQRILKRKGLVRKLLAAETLGAVDVICADKTGTLTQGKMTVIKAEATDDKEIIKAGILCNNLTNPLERSMMKWGENKLKIKSEKLKVDYPRINEIPFSSQRKFIATMHRLPEKNRVEMFVSGAPEILMAMSKMTKIEKDQWHKKLKDYGKSGLRVVAFSYLIGDLKKIRTEWQRLTNKTSQLSWLGLLIFEDPPRLEAKEALELCRKAGIQVKVITGDYRETAEAILDKLAVIVRQLTEEQVMSGKELEAVSDDELLKRIDKVILFYRTTPEQKIRIVKALQVKGHVVGMMGDGVNDALALKKADIGIVVAEASDVARETADMVLLDSNFNTIAAAIEEGRGIFVNIKKVLLYLLFSSFTEIILIGGSLFLGIPLPVTAGQILWVNLIQDGLPSLALAFEPKEVDLMLEKPRRKEEPLLDSELKILIFIIGIITNLCLLSLFIGLSYANFDLKLRQTIIFTSLGINSLFYIFSCKNLKRNLWQINLVNNKFLLLSVIFGFLMMIMAVYIPGLQLILKTVGLKWSYFLFIIPLQLFNVFLIELVKWWFLRKKVVTI